jgi:hypothetical protein
MNCFHIFIFLVLLSLHSNAQKSGLKTIPSNYEGMNTSPWLFTEGDTLVIEADSIFIVNANRYHFYRDIHQNILSSDDSACSQLLNSYEARINNFEMRYQELANNSQETQVVTLGILEESMEELEKTKIDLEEAQLGLQESREGLDEAKKELRKERSSYTKKKILIGAGGLLIGLVLGILIAL